MRKNEQSGYDLMSRFYLAKKQDCYDKIIKKRMSDKKLDAVEVETGIILPCKGNKGGVCDENFKFIAGLLVSKYDPTGRYINDSYSVNKDELEYSDETVVFGGVMQDHPGHQVLEGITSRMWWYTEHPDCNLRVAILAIWGDGRNSFIKEYFDLFGLPEEKIIFIEKPTQFKKIIVPDQSIYSKDFLSKEYMLPIERIKQNVEPSNYKKIYLTRQKGSKQDIVNEEYFIDFYKKKGFEIIHPELHTMREKVSFFRGAKEVACLGGTSALYTLFSESDVKVFILGRSTDPVGEFYVPFEAAEIKDCYVIDCSLNFLHHNRVWGVNLVGPTDYWREFVKDYYLEDLEETPEQTIRAHAYDYLKRCAEYYSEPKLFNVFKMFSHFQILDLLNKVFLGRNLDPSKFNLSNTETQLKLTKNALDFFEALCYDSLINKRMYRFLMRLKGKKLAILSAGSLAGKFLQQAAAYLEIKVAYKDDKSALSQLSQEELNICKTCDVVISCQIYASIVSKKDSVQCISVWDILRDDSLTANLPPLPSTDTALLDAVTEELRAAREALSAQNAQIAAKLTEYHSGLERAEIFERRINQLDSDKDKLNIELGRMSAENQVLREKLSESDRISSELRIERDNSAQALEEAEKKHSEELSAILADKHKAVSERDKLKDMVKELESSVGAFTEKNKALSADKERIIGERDKLRGRTKELESDIGALTDKNKALNADKERIIGERDKLRGRTKELESDIGALIEKNKALSADKERIIGERDKLRGAIKGLESDVGALTERNKTIGVQNEQLTASVSNLSIKLSSAEERAKKLEYEQEELGRALTHSSAETKQAHDALSAANQEIERLMDKIYQMENSRSWRYTRIFRKKPTEE